MNIKKGAIKLQNVIKINDSKTVKKKLSANILNNKFVYLLLLPGVLSYILFSYVPMYGITLAFKHFMFNKGILGSPWTGLENFKYVFIEADFWNAVKNTLIISFGKIIILYQIFNKKELFH